MTDNRLLQAFYDTLLVTCGAGSRAGETGPFVAVTSPAIAVQPSAFANPYGLANPELTPKSIRALEAFSHFVDPAPKLNLVYSPGYRHSEIFQELVLGSMSPKAPGMPKAPGIPRAPAPEDGPGGIDPSQLAALASNMAKLGEARNRDAAERLTDWRAGKQVPALSTARAMFGLPAEENAHFDGEAGAFAASAGGFGILDDAREELRRWKLMSNLAGTEFLPTFAYPPDWMKEQVADDHNLYAKIDSRSRTLDDSPFTRILDGAREDLAAIRPPGGDGSGWTQLDADLSALEISFKLLRVQLSRPWFRPSLFSLRGIELAGRGPGDFSRGRLDPIDAHKLVFPFYTTEMLVAREIVIKGLAARDSRALSAAIDRRADIRLGPFASNIAAGVAPQISGDRVQLDGIGVVGFVCALLPFFPPRDDER